MEIKRFLLLFAIFATASVLGCSRVVDNMLKDESVEIATAVRFASSIDIEVRASKTAWDNDDKIGIYMLSPDGSIISPYSNYLYTTDASGNLTANSGSEMYYPNNGDKVKFIAYHPHTTALSNDINSVDISNQSEPKKIDFLTATTLPVYDKTTSATPVALAFTHKFSKFVIKTSAGTNITSLAGLKVKIKGLNTKCDINVANGNISNLNTVADIAMRTETDGVQYETILLPASIVAGTVTIEFTLGNKTYTWKPSAIILESNKIYTWNATIHDTEVAINAVNITAWSSVTTNDNVADFQIGDYRNGGVIYQMNATDNKKYKVVSVHESGLLLWMSKTTYNFTGLTFSDSNGADNVELLRKYSTDHKSDVDANTRTTGVFATDFPAAAYCYYYKGNAGTDAFGKWYLPSKKEMIELMDVGYPSNGTHYSKLLKTFTERNGTAIYNSCWISAISGNNILGVNPNKVEINKYEIFELTRNSTAGTRCIKVIE